MESGSLLWVSRGWNLGSAGCSPPGAPSPPPVLPRPPLVLPSPPPGRTQYGETIGPSPRVPAGGQPGLLPVQKDIPCHQCLTTQPSSNAAAGESPPLQLWPSLPLSSHLSDLSHKPEKSVLVKDLPGWAVLPGLLSRPNYICTIPSRQHLDSCLTQQLHDENLGGHF